MRSSRLLRRACAALALAVAATSAELATPVEAGAQEGLLETLIVPATPPTGPIGPRVRSETRLQQGQSYRIVASGVHDRRPSGSGQVDPLYCFAAGCLRDGRPAHEGRFALSFIGYDPASSAPADLIVGYLGQLGNRSAPDLPYEEDHSYEERFTPRTSQRLEAYVPYWDSFKGATGEFRVEIWGPPAPATPPPGAPPPAGAPPAEPGVPGRPIIEALKKEAEDGFYSLGLIVMAFCPSRRFSYCGQLVGAMVKLARIVDDPPDDRFGRVKVVRMPRPAGRPGRAADGLRSAERAYGRAISQLSAAVGGLADAGERFTAAQIAGSAEGMLIQSGAAKAYAGAAASGLAGLRRPGLALARATRRAGRSLRVSRATLRRGARRGLRLAGSDQERDQIAEAFERLPRSVNIGKVLGDPLPTEGFESANQSITVAEIRALVQAFAVEGSIPADVAGLLVADLDAVDAAPDAEARQRAIDQLYRDALDRPPAAYAALLSWAARGLGGRGSR